MGIPVVVERSHYVEHIAAAAAAVVVVVVVDIAVVAACVEVEEVVDRSYCTAAAVAAEPEQSGCYSVVDCTNLDVEEQQNDYFGCWKMIAHYFDCHYSDHLLVHRIFAVQGVLGGYPRGRVSTEID